jgi:predicted RNase H-like nuclease (RuvC/YqgF family)
MAKKITIAEEAVENLRRNPPTWQQAFEVIDRHMERMERENARLQRKVGRLETENGWLKDEVRRLGGSVK